MNPEPNDSSAAPATSGSPSDSGTPANATASRPPVSRLLVLALGTVAALALLLNGLLWERLSTLQQQLARQSMDTGASAALANQAQAQGREMAARLAVLEARLGEVALQRAQLDELMQSLSRTRDENLVVDLESAIRLAQQQTQLTGSVEPLLAALRTAEQRLTRTPQPRLAPVQRALARDLARIKATPVADTSSLLLQLDELARMTAQLPLANAVARSTTPDTHTALQTRPDDSVATWWERSLRAVRDELRGLVRVSRIEDPDAALLSPEQSFFVRENLRLMLLSARLGLLARQPEAVRADLGTVATVLKKYFDPATQRSRAVALQLQQVQAQLQTLALPGVDDTLAALATAAGR